MAYNWLWHLTLTSLYLLIIAALNKAHNCGCQHAGYQPDTNGLTNSNEAFISDSGGTPYNAPNSRILQFYPNYLDFREQYVGMPHAESVTLFNPSNEYSIKLHPRKPSSSFFYVSTYDIEEIPPLGNTTVKIVFIAYLPGSIESTVAFSTSHGSFNYQVFATGLPNPYRLRAFVGAKIPYNGTFSPYINMFNPYDEPLQIVEMYSSGGDLHLEPPQLNVNLTRDIWSIPPYETKPIMKVSYHGMRNMMYRGFVRIKCSLPAAAEDLVVLPMEVEVTDQPIVFTNIDALDFGMLRTMDEPKSLNLNLYNNGNSSVTIASITVTPKNKAVNVHYSSVIIKPCKKYTRAATITFSAYHVTHKKQSSGLIVITFGSKSNQVLEIPYQATVLKGTMAYSVSRTTFFALDAILKPVTQDITITNTFNFPLLIYNATLPPSATGIFIIRNFTKNMVVQPGKLVSPLSIEHRSSETTIPAAATLRLYTNASIFTIPIHSYSGQVKYLVEGGEQNIMEYGTVGTLENRSITFKIINDNPVEVSIKEYNSNVEFVRLRLLHVQSFKKAKVSKKNDTSSEQKNSTIKAKEMDDKIVLQPKEVAVFTADMTAPDDEGSHKGEVKIITSYEEIRVPVYVRTVMGGLIAKPKRINFRKMFPGKTESYTLSLTSTFPRALAIKKVELVPADPRFVLSWTTSDLPALVTNMKYDIGRVQFNALLGSPENCYICLCRPDPVCSQWIESLALPAQTWEIDLDLLEKSKRIWDNMIANGDNSINTSLVVDTEIIRGYSIPVHASLTWPSIVQQSVQFPATHINNVSVKYMTLHNPSDVPVVAQVLSLHNYPHSQGSLDFLADRFEIDSFSTDGNNDGLFFLHDIEKVSQSQRKKVHKKLKVWPSLSTFTKILKPRSNTKVAIGFKPTEERMETSVMVVRNNLTVLDLVVIQGQGAKSEFTINDKKPGTNSVLLFELKASHLSDCSKTTPKARTFPSFTVKRSFVATNAGQLPISVTSLNINDYECEGYGFRIIDCSPFVLLPNTSKNIDISFSPDFTTSRVVRNLRVITSMEPLLEFTLLATLPRHMLSLCASALPRPFWEPYLHVIVALVMSSAFIVVIFLAYFDAQKYVLQCTFTFSRNNKTSNDIYPMGTVFDLNAVVGASTRYEERRNGDCKSSKYYPANANDPRQPTSSFTLKNKLIDTTLTRSRSSSSSSDCSYRSQINTTTSNGDVCPTNNERFDNDQNNAKRKKTSNVVSRDVKQNGLKETKVRRKSQNIDVDEDKLIIPVDKPRIVYEDTLDAVQQQDDDKKNKLKKRSKQSGNKKETKLKDSSSNSIDSNVTTPPTISRSSSVLGIPSYFRSSYDKLDEITITGPTPDVSQLSKANKSSKLSDFTTNKRKFNIFNQHGELAPSRSQGTPSYSTVNKSISGKQRKSENSPSKKKSDIGTESAPIKQQDLKLAHRRSSPRLSDITCLPRSQSSSNDAWPFTKSQTTSPTTPTSFSSRIIKDTSSNPTKEGSVWNHPKTHSKLTTRNSDSMFYYDNLSSLRSSKENTVLNRAPGSKPRYTTVNKNESPVIKSKLSADSAEFIPSSSRMAPIGSRQKQTKSKSDLSIDSLGLHKSAAVSSIWSGSAFNDGNEWSTSLSGLISNNGRDDTSSLLDSLDPDSHYSSLLPSDDDDDQENFVTTGVNCDNDIPSMADESDIWLKDTDDTTDNSSDFGWPVRSSGLNRSIWSTDTADPTGQNVPRSLIGLDLSLPLHPSPGPVEQSSVDQSPLSPFGSIWSSPRNAIDLPYDGWMKDISKQEEN